jgi:hypothetical protein
LLKNYVLRWQEKNEDKMEEGIGVQVEVAKETRKGRAHHQE